MFCIVPWGLSKRGSRTKSRQTWQLLWAMPLSYVRFAQELQYSCEELRHILLQSPQFINATATHPFPPLIFRTLMWATCCLKLFNTIGLTPPLSGSSCRLGSTPFFLSCNSLFPSYILIPWHFLPNSPSLIQRCFRYPRKIPRLKIRVGPFPPQH